MAASTDDSPEFSEKYPDIYWSTIEDIFSEMAKEDVEENGIILNPDKEDLTFTLDKDLLNKILNYTPPENKMLYFDGNDENVTLNCYRSCLNLAKKYHLVSVAFPSYFIGSMPLVNEAINLWFEENKDYGMTVFIENGKGGKFRG